MPRVRKTPSIGGHKLSREGRRVDSIFSNVNNEMLQYYVPDFVKYGGVDAHNTHMRTAVMFADVSGFTAMTDQMSASGPAGLEILVENLNAMFAIVLETISACGGDVMRFAGDAIEVYWPMNHKSGTTHLSMSRVVTKALRCGLVIQKALEKKHNVVFRSLDGSEQHRLRIKVGIAYGDVWVIHLGSGGRKREFVAVGPGLTAAHDSECYAKPGQVVVSEQVVKIAGYEERCKAVERADGFFIISEERKVHGFNEEETVSISPTNSLNLVGSREQQRQVLERLRKYIPVSVMPYLKSEDEFWLPEFRRVTSMFVNLGVDLSSDKVTKKNSMEKLHTAFDIVQSCVQQYEGAINKVFFDKKATNIFIIFGLPPFAHSDDAKRGVLCALTMMSRLTENQFEGQAIGITTGLAFCGVLGGRAESASRKKRFQKEYSVIGDCINIASRIMYCAKKDGEHIYADETTKRATIEHIPYGPGMRKVLKGKRFSVQVFHVGRQETKETKTSASVDNYQTMSNRRARRMSKLVPLTPLPIKRTAGSGVSTRSNQPVRYQMPFSPEALDRPAPVQGKPGEHTTLNKKEMQDIVENVLNGRHNVNLRASQRADSMLLKSHQPGTRDMLATLKELQTIADSVELLGCTVVAVEGFKGTGKTYSIAQVFMTDKAKESYRVAYCAGNPFHPPTQESGKSFYAWKTILLKLYDLYKHAQDMEEFMTDAYRRGKVLFNQNDGHEKFKHGVNDDALFYLNDILGVKMFSGVKKPLTRRGAHNLKDNVDDAKNRHSVAVIDRMWKRESKQSGEKQVEECASLIAMIIAGISTLHPEKPVVTLIDDSQYLHPFSWLVCLELAQWYHTANLLIVLIRTKFPFENVSNQGSSPYDDGSVRAQYRKQNEHFTKIDQQFAQLMHLRKMFTPMPNFSLLEVSMDSAYTKEVILNTLSVPECPDILVDFLSRKTQGNPLYINDALRDFMDDDMIEVVDGELVVHEEFCLAVEKKDIRMPISVESVCGELLDSLSTTQQVALKVAAMHTETFFIKEEILKVYPLKNHEQLSLDSEWDSLCNAGILYRITPGSMSNMPKSQMYSFAQEWMKESLINRMLFKQRERIQQLMADR